MNLEKSNELIKRQSCHHIETSQLICTANQLTGVYMMATVAFTELKDNPHWISPVIENSILIHWNHTFLFPWDIFHLFSKKIKVPQIFA